MAPFVLSVLFLALGLLVSFPAPPPTWDAAYFALYAALLSAFQVPLPGEGRVSLHFVGALAGALNLPPLWAGVAAGLSHLPYTRKLEREIFNRSQLFLAAASASALHQALPGLHGEVLAGSVYFVVNTGAFLFLARFVLRKDPASLWRTVLKSFALSYLGLVPMAVLATRLYASPAIFPVRGLDPLLLVVPGAYAWHMWRLQRKTLQAVEDMVKSLVWVLEARDPHTALHSERVAVIALDLAKELGLPPEVRNLLLRAAKLHDLGKVGVPDAALLKEGALTPEEWERMRLHPELGWRLLAPLEDHLGPVVRDVVLHHHERWDGSGYPRGLKGEEIPLLARILAVADAYEAMTADRPYRRALSPEEAALRIQRGAGSQFDPEVVEAFLRALRRDPPWKWKGRFERATLGVREVP